jgi:hypothetical protein
LQNVPPAPESPDDPEREKKRQAWMAWRNAVEQYAENKVASCEGNTVRQDLENHKCSLSPAYWLAVYGKLYEPRRRKRLSGVDTRFIPFARQVEMLDFFQACLKEDDGPLVDGVVSKCRDVGASWIMCAFALWGWLYESPWQVRLISRKKDLVESRSADSLFWKIDYLFNRLPKWMVPSKSEYNDVDLHFTNLLNGNEISGESTTSKAVRGGRATWVGYDEAAFIEDFLHTWSAAQAVADSRFAISTESMKQGRDFWNLSQNKKIPEPPARFAIDWWQNPTLADEWLDKTRSRYMSSHDLAGFEREVLRNPFGDSESFVYPEAHGMALSMEHAYNPQYAQYTTIDPGVRDDCAIVFLQTEPFTGLIHVLDSYSNSGKPADFYGTILTGKPESGQWEYDMEALRIMDWTRNRPRATVYGDVAGWNQEAATMESFFSRLQKYEIYAVRDRDQGGHVIQSKRAARSHRGRREALREIMPRLRFANTPGAAKVLEALEMHRYKEADRAVQSEERTPLHDWTSHLTSALEYFAVNKVLERQITEHGLAQLPQLGSVNHRRERNRDTLARWERSLERVAL